MEGVRTELAAAVRRVNAIFYALPDPKPNVNGWGWSELEEEIDAAITTGDRVRALRAIQRWEAHARSVLGVDSR
jgi:hypothetical protein